MAHHTLNIFFLSKDSSFVAIKGVQKRRDFVAGRRVVIVCDHDIMRNYCFHWLNVGSGESQRDKGAVVLMSSWNNRNRAQAFVFCLRTNILSNDYLTLTIDGIEMHQWHYESL